MSFGENDYMEDAEKFASLTGLFLGSDEVEVFRHAYNLSGHRRKNKRCFPRTRKACAWETHHWQRASFSGCRGRICHDYPLWQPAP